MTGLLLILAVAGSAGAAGHAAASFPEPWVSVERQAPVEASLFCVPDGSGRPFADADGFGGYTVDATLEIVLYDGQPGYGSPVPNFPAEDIWLWASSGDLAPCRGGTIPDADTDADGRTSWAQPLRTGGWFDPAGGAVLEIWALGQPATVAPDLNLRINGADLNGDGETNLTDAGNFASDLFGGYAYRSDFVWDGVINLSDVGRMAAALGRSCP